MGSPSWEFEWSGTLAIPLWEALWLKVQNSTTWADSPGKFFLWRRKVWNSILFRSIDSCGLKSVELSLKLGFTGLGI